MLKSKINKTIGGDNMTFEEKLSQMYNKIASEISGMIPVESRVSYNSLCN